MARQPARVIVVDDITVDVQRSPARAHERRIMNRSAGSSSTGLRQVIRVVSDGTGRPEDEVVVVAAVAATAIVSVAVWRGIAWAVETATDVDPWPVPPKRHRL
jgi:hypothetical protein